MDDHEKAEENNVDGDGHDDISTRIVRIKTTRKKMKRTGMIIMTISTGVFLLRMIMKNTTRIKMNRTMKMRDDDDDDISIGCLSLGYWG